MLYDVGQDMVDDVCEGAPKELMLLVQIGSRTYRICAGGSDVDFGGVFVKPLREILSISGGRKGTYVSKDPDCVFHELERFCSLAIKGNPGILEMLYSKDILHITRGGEALREIRGKFLHRGSLRPYFGYYEQQRRRLEKGQSLHTSGGKWNTKYAGHLIRLLHCVKHLAETGEVLVHLDGKARADIIEIRKGEWGVDRVLGEADKLLDEARAAELRSVLPEKPDLGVINDLIYNIRMEWGWKTAPFCRE